MMDDNRFDELIARSAGELDQPPVPPRDEMWAAIQGARAAARNESAEDAENAVPASAGSSVAPSRPWLRYGAALAAMLVIGIGIGRIPSARDGSVDPQATADARGRDSIGADSRPNADALPASGTVAAADPSASAGDAPGDAGTLPGTDTAIDPRIAAIDRAPVTRVAPAEGGPALARAARPSSPAGTVVRENGGAARTYDALLPYRIVARRHLGRVQTLLVSLPSDVREGRINDVAVRAADLLVNTRLLLDSPAADDPQTQRLLDDLELILAQVATISPTRSAEEVDMIQNAINQRDVLLRLHAATAGSRLTGT